MSRDDVLLRRIEAEMRLCAQSALASPSARDAFEYGRVSGIYAGLHRAFEIVVELNDEEDVKDI